MKPIYAGGPAPGARPEDAGRARGNAIRQAHAIRKRTLRRRVISGALALFVAAWLMITIVLISGHDPALAKQQSAVVASSGQQTQTSTGSGSGTSSSSTGSTTPTTTTTTTPTTSSASSSTTSSGTSGTSSVTTRQS
jgi:cytoskeletal protein RodZ